MLETNLINEQIVYQRPQSMADISTHYCPGCTHGIAHRLVSEVLDEMGIREKTIGVASVGCSAFAYNYFDCDFVQAPHGQSPGHGYRDQTRPSRPGGFYLPGRWGYDLHWYGGNCPCRSAW